METDAARFQISILIQKIQIQTNRLKNGLRKDFDLL